MSTDYGCALTAETAGALGLDAGDTVDDWSDSLHAVRAITAEHTQINAFIIPRVVISNYLLTF